MILGMSEDEFLARLSFPIVTFLTPHDRLGYIFQLSALAAAVGVWLWLRWRGKTARSLWRYVFAPEVWLHRSAVTDYLYYFVNRLLWVFAYGWFIVWAEASAEGSAALLRGLVGEPGPGVTPHWGWAVLATLLIVLVKDFLMWFAHTLFHLFPVLWEFHKVHHSAEVMTPLTAARMHPVEELLTATIVGTGVGVAWTGISHILGPGAHELKLWEINVVTALFFLAAFNLRHSHVWLAYPHWLQHILISPAQHQIHHSTAPQHWDKNMGFTFAFWDWAFGTLYSPRGYEKIDYGLGTAETPAFQSVRALYFRPFRNLWAMLKERFIRLRQRLSR